MQIKFTFNINANNYNDIEQILLNKLESLTGIKFIEGDYILFGIRQIKDKKNRPLIELGIYYDDYNREKFSEFIGIIQDTLYNDICGITNIQRTVLDDSLRGGK